MELPERGETVLETARLRLRRFQASDLEPFVALNLDPVVMRFLGGPCPRETTLEWVAIVEAGWDRIGRGMLPVERASDGAFLGVAGVTRMTSFPEDVEVGWRLRPEAWGQGYATEAGRAWVGWAFARHGLGRVIAVCDLPNARSRAVMARLGMTFERVATVEEDGAPVEVAVHAVTREAWERGA